MISLTTAGGTVAGGMAVTVGAGDSVRDGAAVETSGGEGRAVDEGIAATGVAVVGGLSPATAAVPSTTGDGVGPSVRRAGHGEGVDAIGWAPPAAIQVVRSASNRPRARPSGRFGFMELGQDPLLEVLFLERHKIGGRELLDEAEKVP